MTADIQIRKAGRDDLPVIEDVIEELDLGHPSIPPDSFRVVVADGRISAIVNIEDRGPCFYLSAMGVSKEMQGRGIARELLSDALARCKKDVYLYTRIPDFFARFGFASAEGCSAIPPREIYGCEACAGDKPCVCMVRRADASSVPGI